MRVSRGIATPLTLALAIGVARAGAASAAAPRDSSALRDSGSAAAAAAVTDSAARDSLPFALVARGDLAPREGRGDELVEPSGITLDSFGRCYVADAARHRLLRYAPDGQLLGQSGSLGSETGDLRRPGAVALLGTLNVAVLDVENRRVLMYDLFDRLQGTLIDFDGPELASLGRIEPVALASDFGGAVYVADSERDRLLVFDFSGRWIRTVGGYGTGSGSFRGLAGVGIARRGDIVTTERAGRRVQRLDPGGTPRASWALPLGRGRGALPVAVDDSLRVAVADEASGRLWVFARDGSLLAAAAGFRRPRALVFAPDASLLVVEAGAARIRRFGLVSKTPAGE